MYIKNQYFFILGISKSGYSVAKYLLSKSAKVFVYDDNKSEKVLNKIDELISCGAIKVEEKDIEKYVDLCNILVISPGVAINHEIAVMSKKKGKRIMGELEFSYATFFPNIIAITGTNGKTTTVSLLDEILNKSGTTHSLVGNIGIPFSSILDEEKKDIYIAEVSSFQLESISSFCPHISCILNITPDHLERHYTMENYIFLKSRIFRNQRESEYTVINYDDEIVRSFYCEIKAKVIFVSLKERVDGAYLLNGKIYFFDEYIIDADDLSLKGNHNIYNSLFAIASAKLIGIDNGSIVEGLTSFRGVRHRLERFLIKDEVTFYNDSKSTNTASCINAIEYISSPFVLILGGSEKGENYDCLFNLLKNKNVRQVILTGASRINMLNSAIKCQFNKITMVEDFSLSIKYAILSAQRGDSVLFSPACASFDRFNNYEERGDEFIKIVRSLVD